MPRGIYDRSKSKEQRAAEKAPAKKSKAAAAPQKRKYTKRATANVSAEKMSAPKAAMSADMSFAMISEVRQNLAVLAQLGDKFQDTPSLQSEVSAHVELLGKLREKTFAIEEASNDTTAVETEEVEEAAPVAAAPNGTAAYQGTVPLPPPPSVASVLPPPAIPAH